MKKIRCSAEVKQILLRALATSPAERYASAADIATDLRHCLLEEAPHFSKRDLAAWLSHVFSTPESLPSLEKVPLLALESPFERRQRNFAPRTRPVRTQDLGKYGLIFAVLCLIILGASELTRMRRATPPRQIAVTPSSPAAVPIVPKPTVPVIPPSLEEKPKPVVSAENRLPAGTCSVRIHSVPMGAAVAVNAVYLGQTPLLAHVPCGQTIACRLNLQGYRAAVHRFSVDNTEGEVKFTLEKDSGR